MSWPNHLSLHDAFVAILVTAPFNFPAGLFLRLSRPDDLLPLHTHCFAHIPFNRFNDTFQRSLREQARGNRLRLVIAKAKEIVATGQLLTPGGQAEIADLFVVETHRGQGIGTGIITLLTNIAGRARFNSVEIGVVITNHRALTLYEQLGFVRDRELRLPGNEPAIILRKEIGNGKWQIVNGKQPSNPQQKETTPYKFLK